MFDFQLLLGKFEFLDLQSQMLGGYVGVAAFRLLVFECKATHEVA
jgi:hypothetical protein